MQMQVPLRLTSLKLEQLRFNIVELLMLVKLTGVLMDMH
jgi:hypothetical protein